MPTPVLPSGFSYCQQVQVTGGGASATGNPTSLGGSVVSSSSDYVVALHLTGATASTIYGQLQHPPSATALDSTATADVGVYWWNGSAWTQIDYDLDQVTNGVWSTGNITLWFKLQATLAASPATDGDYMLAWGAATVNSPSWGSLYPLADDFLGTTLNTGVWTDPTPQPSYVSVASSVMTLATTAAYGSNQIIGTHTGATFGAGYAYSVFANYVARNDEIEHGFRAYSGASTVSSPIATIDIYNSGNGITVRQAQSGGAVNVATLRTDASLSYPTGYHLWSVARAPSSGQAYGSYDGAAYSSSSTSNETAATLPVMFQGRSGGQTLSVDWVKIRPWMTTEPTTALTGSVVSGGGGPTDPFPLAYNRPNQLVSQPIYSM